MLQADIGLGAAVVHFASRHRAGDSTFSLNRLLTVATAWTCGAAVLVLPVYVVIAFSLTMSTTRDGAVTSNERWTLIALACALTASLGLRAYPAILQGTGHWVLERRNQMAGVVCRVILTIGACWLGTGIIWVASAETLAALTPTVLSLWKVRSLGLASFSRRELSGQALRIMLAYSAKSFSVGAMAAIIIQSGTIVVGITSSASEVTYFSAAQRIYYSIRQILTWVTDPFRPTLSRMFALDVNRARRVVASLMFLSLAGTVTSCFALSLLLQPLLTIWLPDGLPIAKIAVATQFLLAAAALNSIHTPAVPAADSFGRPGVFFKLHASWAGMQLASSFVLGYTFGFQGVALAALVPLIVLEPLYLRKASKVLGISVNEWVTQSFMPTVGVGLLAWATAMGAGRMIEGALASAVEIVIFSAVVLIAAVLLRKRLPLKHLRAAMQTQV